MQYAPVSLPVEFRRGVLRVPDTFPLTASTPRRGAGARTLVHGFIDGRVIVLSELHAVETFCALETLAAIQEESTWEGVLARATIAAVEQVLSPSMAMRDAYDQQIVLDAHRAACPHMACAPVGASCLEHHSTCGKRCHDYGRGLIGGTLPDFDTVRALARVQNVIDYWQPAGTTRTLVLAAVDDTIDFVDCELPAPIVRLAVAERTNSGYPTLSWQAEDIPEIARAARALGVPFSQQDMAFSVLEDRLRAARRT